MKSAVGVGQDAVVGKHWVRVVHKYSVLIRILFDLFEER